MISAFSYIYWNVNPELFKIGPLTVRWYGVLFALAFYCGFLIVQRMFRMERKKEQDLNSLLLYMVAGAVIGARLGHCFFYEPDYYFKHPPEILEIWRGGLASHGGAAGILIAIYFYARRQRDQPYLWVMDRVVIPTALGGAFIRVGNLINSEILGVPTNVPWAFIFPQSKVDLLPRHPVQLYEALGYALIFVLLLTLYRRWRAQTPKGLIFGIFLVTVFGFRFFMEFLKQPQADYEQGLPLRVGQWLSIPFVVYGVFLIWRVARSKEGRTRLEIKL